MYLYIYNNYSSKVVSIEDLKMIRVRNVNEKRILLIVFLGAGVIMFGIINLWYRDYEPLDSAGMLKSNINIADNLDFGLSDDQRRSTIDGNAKKGKFVC